MLITFIAGFVIGGGVAVWGIAIMSGNSYDDAYRLGYEDAAREAKGR